MKWYNKRVNVTIPEDRLKTLMKVVYKEESKKTTEDFTYESY